MRCSHVFFRAALAGLIAGSVAAFSPAIAAVYSSDHALSPQVIQQFLANPDALLAQYPAGGAKLIAQVRDLAASDPATLKALLSLLKEANPEQASAVGTGLGQVAIMAVKTDQAYATQIQEGVLAAQNDSALVAFSAAIGGSIQLTAATGGGGGGGGGGAEEGTGQFQNFGGSFAGTSETFTTSVANKPDIFQLTFTPGVPIIPGGNTIIQNVSASK
jgi:hypothetical protein